MTPKEKKAVVECVVSLADIHATYGNDELAKNAGEALKKMEETLGITEECDRALMSLLFQRMKDSILKGLKEAFEQASLDADDEDEEEDDEEDEEE